MDRRGKRVTIIARNMHGVRHNVFAALSSDGLNEMEFFLRNAGNIETLMYFLQPNLLPVMHPIPLPNSVCWSSTMPRSIMPPPSTS